MILFSSFPEAEETLLIDIATNSKFYNCSHVAKAPFRKQAVCWALMHAYFTYHFIVFLHTLCLSFDQAGIVIPVMLSGSSRQSVVMTDAVLNAQIEVLAIGQTLTS